MAIAVLSLHASASRISRRPPHLSDLDPTHILKLALAERSRPLPQPAAPLVASHAPRLADLGLRGERPLALIDVDEVLGLFMQGFGQFLQSRGLELRVDRYALFQNIYEPGAETHLPIEAGRAHFDDFFRYGCGDMEPAPGAVEGLRRISGSADVVILTNAPGAARLARARWLGRHRLDYPLVLNSGPKGPVAAALVRQTRRPAAFVDDLVSNLDSVAEAAPQVARFQMVADPRLRPLAPAAPERHTRIDDWPTLAQAVEAALA